MKKFIILALALLTVAGASAQKTEKAAKQIVTTVFITDIDCEGCTKKIYDNFYGKGVRSVKCDVATKSVAVTYDASKNTPEGLKPSFADLKVKVVKPMSAEEFEHYKQHHSHQGHSHGHHGHKH
jgi:copper chaperone CopZ